MTDYSDIYSISFDPIHNRIQVKIIGHFTTESHNFFKDEVANAVKSYSIGRKINMLFDLMDAKTQSKEIAEDNGWMMALAPKVNKVATAIESMIYKMQIQRMELGSKMQFFDSLESAQKWLESE